jgi:hypothetical protein
MIKNVLFLSAIVIMGLALGCSSSTPTVPDKISNVTPEEYFNQLDLSSRLVARYTLKDNNGDVIQSGKLGRNDNGELYVLENRGAQYDIDFSGAGIVDVGVRYNNPSGTIESGENIGLPYYYLGEDVDYNIDIAALRQIGNGAYNTANITAEMHYATFDADGDIIEGALLPGSPTWTWNGIIPKGFSTYNDTFEIDPGTETGLDITTVEVDAVIFFGLLEIIYYDGIAGVWDPQ